MARYVTVSISEFAKIPVTVSPIFISLVLGGFVQQTPFFNVENNSTKIEFSCRIPFKINDPTLDFCINSRSKLIEKHTFNLSSLPINQEVAKQHKFEKSETTLETSYLISVDLPIRGRALKMSAPETDSSSVDDSLGKVYRKRSVSKGGQSPKGGRAHSVSSHDKDPLYDGTATNDYISSLKKQSSGRVRDTSQSRETEVGGSGSGSRRSGRSASLAGPPPTRPPPGLPPSRSSSGESIESRTEPSGAGGSSDENPPTRKQRRSPRDSDSYANDSAPSLSPKGHREHSPPPDTVAAPDLPLVVVQDCSRPELSKKTSQEFKFGINSVVVRDITELSGENSHISEESDRSDKSNESLTPLQPPPVNIHPALMPKTQVAVSDVSPILEDTLISSPKRDSQPRSLPSTQSKPPAAFIRNSDSLGKKPRWKYVPGISFAPEQTEPFLCEITKCGSRFGDESSVMTHLRSSHDVYNLYACACGSRFAMKYSLNLHLGKCSYEPTPSSECSSTETEGDTSEPAGPVGVLQLSDIPAFQQGLSSSSDGVGTPPGTPTSENLGTPKKRKKREISLPLAGSGSRESLPVPGSPGQSGDQSTGEKKRTPRNGKSPRRTKSEDATPGQDQTRKKKTEGTGRKVEDLLRKNTVPSSSTAPGLTQLEERASEESK